MTGVMGIPLNPLAMPVEVGENGSEVRGSPAPLKLSSVCGLPPRLTHPLAMAGLNTEQQAAFQTLLEFGCSETDARKAVLRFGGNVAAAANWIYDGAVEGPAAADDDAPPPLISTDAELPHPSTLGQPPPYSGPELPPFGPAAPAVEQKNLIDLTNDDEPPPAFAPPRLLPAPHPSPTLGPSNAPTSGGADLSKAIKASQTAADDQDADLSKAISLSMASLGSTDEQAVSEVEKIKPEDRIRKGNSPPVLRATSAFMSGLAAFLQALYAVPSFRNGILSYRLPENRQHDGLAVADFKDYWKGDAGISSLGMPIPVDGEQENRFTRLVALQRLFALMTETKRSFLHITEVVRAFGLRESDFKQPGGAWVYKVLEVHSTIVDDLRLAAGEEAQYRLSQGVSPEEAEQYEQKATSRFIFRGRVVTANEHLGAPLPPNDDDVHSNPRLSLPLNPSADPPEDLFRLLDKQLVTSNGSDNLLHLLTQVPTVLFFHIDRMTNVTSLDSFGSGNNSLQKRVFRPTPTGKEDVWLDRYWVKNRVRIHETRLEIAKLDAELEEVRKQRKAIVVTEDGKDFQELVRATVAYCKSAKAEAGNVEREERQKRMREDWEKVEEELKQAVDAFDTQISDVSLRIASAFDSPDMHKIGPYRLTSFVVRNGLNGRGTAWSVVCDDDGKWWRTGDLDKKEVSLEEALGDPSGLMMDAGSTFFFYSKVDEAEEEVEVPPHLKNAAARDNIEFALTLPDALADVVASWNLPPLSSLEPEAIQIPLGETADDDAETVKDISLDTPPPDDVMIDEQAANQVDTPMSLEESQQAGEFPAMQLRGGATIEDDDGQEDGVELDGADEEEESDYDDEIDEDEVELGLLQPMPVKKEDWDIDYAVGKIGGKPVWLDPRSPLAPEDVECGACGRTMSMLLQVNSPDDTRPHAAARSLYVYACRTSGCLAKNPSQAVRVWRTQMESPNAFFPHTEETLKERTRLEDALDAATALASAPSSSAKSWPEFDIAAEPEPYEESYLPSENAPAAEAEEGTEDAAATDTKTGVDSAFLHFQERIEREPKQVLRFYRLPGIEDPQPLWASEDKIRPEQVPTCELCRGERKVEFQILSTLLTSLDDDSFDFDSILVYTCANHCPIPPREGGKTGWQVECAFKQDFAAAGVKFGRR
ncbi:Proteophosphoglycan ppg4 [Rhodotorula toruloides]|uniref:Proteophosphoglycan ppg4 n=1 Tax=Rhodotorula toruloides TaxID=5286 RepID=A0A2S9ZZ68_RHOTO|nr:Proteophosphoglycan ppg4 [Rhodotorula toruloides]